MQTQPEKTFDLTLVAEQPGTTTVKISEKDIRRVFPDKSSKTPWWTHAWNIISMIILGIAVILAIYYFDDWWENCYDCYKTGEMSEDLRIKTQEEIEDEASNVKFGDFDPNATQPNSSSTSSSTQASPVSTGEKELSVASEEVLLKCWDLVHYYNSKYSGLLTFEKPDGFSKEILVAAIAAHECIANPDTTNGLSGSNLAVGFLQTKQIRVDDFNRIFPGFNFTLRDVRGEYPGVKNSLIIYSKMIRHYTDEDKKRDLNVLTNSQINGMNNKSSTPYSRCMIKNMEKLRDALENRKSSKSNFWWGFYKNPLPGSTWEKRHHDGDPTAVDLKGINLGTPVFSAADGTARVVYNKDDPDRAGNRIYITDKYCEVMYGHLDKMIVTNGQRVKAGQKIGTVGLTGHTTGPHTHVKFRPKRPYAKNFIMPTKYW